MLNEIDLSRADLNLLVLFGTVLRERHVGRAAQSLNLTPSAVSHGLGRLRRLLNDPLFLKTPKGVVPTARAAELAEPIADILARVKRVVSTSAPFDAEQSSRRFTLGAPDSMAAVLLPPLIKMLRKKAPGIDLSVRQILPPPQGRPGTNPWQQALDDVEGRVLDFAIVPIDELPARFWGRTLVEEDFVIAARRGHPFIEAPNLDTYCRMLHLVVSLTRDTSSLIDHALATQGRSRRIALAVSNFMLALGLIAETDLIAALPRSLVKTHARRFGLVSCEVPLMLRKFQVQVLTTRSAMMDAGVAWFLEVLVNSMPTLQRQLK
jgi:DNA-binding transcriptional LysR family regulator